MDINVKKNYVYNLIYQILLIVTPLITAPYISRVLHIEGVGKYSYAYSIISYFILFATLGFSTYAQREIAKYQNNNRHQIEIFFEILVSKTIPVISMLIIHMILLLLNVYGEYELLMLILTINIFSVGFDISYYFEGNEKFGKLVVRNIIIKVSSTLCIFLFVKKSEHVWLYALILALSTFISNITLWGSLIKQLKFIDLSKVKIKKIDILKHIIGSFKLFLPTIAISVYTTLDKVLIGIITKSDIQNGYYDQADKIVRIVLTIITCLGTVMIPRNTSEMSKGNHEKVKENIYNSFNFTWLLGIPLTLGIILISSNFVPWFLGDEFKYCSILMMIFAPLILVIGISHILGLQYMIPYSKEKQYTISYIIAACVNLILNIFLIKKFQSLGAVISTLISEIVVSIVMILFSKNYLSLKQIFKTIIKPLIAGMIMFICVYPIAFSLNPNILNTMIIVILGFIIYSISIVVLREKLVMSFFKQLKAKFKKNN